MSKHTPLKALRELAKGWPNSYEAQELAKAALPAAEQQQLLIEELVRALKSAKAMSDMLAEKISKAQYNADELEQGLEAWETVSDLMYNGVMGSYDQEFEAALTRAKELGFHE